MSLATFNAQTASGEGAHGPDRSKLAKWNHCRTDKFVYWPPASRPPSPDCPGCQQRIAVPAATLTRP